MNTVMKTMKKEYLSYSALSRFEQSPNHLLEYWNGKHETTSAMSDGTLGHMMILEPEKVFNGAYEIYDGRRAGAVWKVFESETLAANPNTTILTRSQYDNVKNYVDKALENPMLRNIMSQVSDVEKYIRWERNGVKMHGFVDGVTDDFLFDIKFCQDSGDRFVRDLQWGNSKMQAAMYLDAFDYDRDYVLIAIEKKSPFNVQAYKLSHQKIQEGRVKYLELLEQYIEWDGKPQGYYSEMIEV